MEVTNRVIDGSEIWKTQKRGVTFDEAGGDGRRRRYTDGERRRERRK